MEFADIKKWVIFFIGILVAIIIADALSNMLMNYSGLTGWVNFVVSFVLYAVFFFAILYVLEKVAGIKFFGFE
jgi:CBS domain containing-hemolysin-like protein